MRYGERWSGKLEEAKKYEPFKIPGRKPPREEEAQAPPWRSAAPPVSFGDPLFYEIELDPGAKTPAPPPQKIAPPVKDEIREQFHAMREIGRARRSPFANPARFYNEAARLENARTFYQQAVLMRDFEDSYEGLAPFSSYFPYYQHMGYEQLRTYFTWRTQVRRGSVSDTSLSYAFLYIYELLHTIGAKDPQDGLERLTAFREAFSAFDNTIGKYLAKWLKEYRIYYGLPVDIMDSFELYCAVSNYDIRKSAFCRENEKLFRDCFLFVLEGLDIEEAVFQPGKKAAPWVPFRNALFHPWLRQPDRHAALSEKEIYVCAQNKWFLLTGGDRRLAGYVMKRMESVLRDAVKYKHRLTAHADPAVLRGLPLEKAIEDAVLEFYREATKIVVSVDTAGLNRIRREALATQEKLAVENLEEEEIEALEEEPKPPDEEPALPQDEWTSLRAALSEPELRLLVAILQGETNLKRFADENGVMLEVLAGGINEKAADHIGDSILDADFSIYEDYKANMTEMVVL